MRSGLPHQPGTAAPTTPCGCGVSPASDEPTPGRRAAGVDPALKAANLKHLRRIEGQVRGVLRMVEDDRYCADIVTQIAAVRASLRSVSENLLRNHVRHCASAAVRDGGERAEAMLDELVDVIAKVAR